MKGERDQAQGTRVLDKGSDLDQEVGEAHPIDGKESGGGGRREDGRASKGPVGGALLTPGRQGADQLSRAAEPAANGTGPAASPKCTTRPVSAPDKKLYLTQN